MSFDRLITKIREMKNPTVVGLDPKLSYVPSYIQKTYMDVDGESLKAASRAIFRFNQEIIDAICDIVPAIKPQAAYYEMYGWQGVKTLYKTIEGFWQSATTSRQKYLASVENVESAEASYELLTEQFNVGVKNIADLLTGRSTLLTAKQNLLQDKYTAVLNRALLDFYATGEFRALQ